MVNPDRTFPLLIQQALNSCRCWQYWELHYWDCPGVSCGYWWRSLIGSLVPGLSVGGCTLDFSRPTWGSRDGGDGEVRLQPLTIPTTNTPGDRPPLITLPHCRYSCTCSSSLLCKLTTSCYRCFSLITPTLVYSVQYFSNAVMNAVSN